MYVVKGRDSLDVIYESEEIAIIVTEDYEEVVNDICQREQVYGFARKVVTVTPSGETVTLCPSSTLGVTYSVACGQSHSLTVMNYNGSTYALPTYVSGHDADKFNVLEFTQVGQNVSRAKSVVDNNGRTTYLLRTPVSDDIDLYAVALTTFNSDAVSIEFALGINIDGHRVFRVVKNDTLRWLLKLINDDILVHLIDLDDVYLFNGDQRRALGTLISPSEACRLTKPLVVVDGARAYRSTITTNATRLVVVDGGMPFAREVAILVGRQLLSEGGDVAFDDCRSNPNMLCRDVEGLGMYAVNLDDGCRGAVFVDTGFPNIPFVAVWFLNGSNPLHAKLVTKAERLNRMMKDFLKTINTLSS